MSDDNIIYLNGEFLPEKDAVVPVTERGFFGGDGVYEVTRTFGHSLFRLDAHLDRLFRSLAYARIDPGLSRDGLAAATLETLDRNLGRLDKDSDYALWHVISRGDSAVGRASPTIAAIFCAEVEFAHYAPHYLDGVRLVTPGVRRTAPESIDPKAKVLSRMNQVQAALEAGRAEPGSIPLLLDTAGNLSETNTGNFFFVNDGRLHTSAPRNVLNGVTRAAILEIAAGLGIETVEGNFTPYDVYAADEAFISSTTPVILPAASLNGAPIGGAGGNSQNGGGKLPGPVTLRLMKRFFELAGVDFVAQAVSRLGGNSSRNFSADWAGRLARSPEN